MTNNIDNRIIESRKSKGFTQKYLAEKMNISLPTMNHYETGKRIPGSDFLARLAKVVDCNPGWLLSGEGDMQTNECYTSSHPPRKALFWCLDTTLKPPPEAVPSFTPSRLSITSLSRPTGFIKSWAPTPKICF